MSYFNSEQRDHMKELTRIDPAQRCWCGWYRTGKCHRCPPDKTLAQRIEVECPSCGNYPNAPDDRLVHRKGCAAEAHARKGGV